MAEMGCHSFFAAWRHQKKATLRVGAVCRENFVAAVTVVENLEM